MCRTARVRGIDETFTVLAISGRLLDAEAWPKPHGPTGLAVQEIGPPLRERLHRGEVATRRAFESELRRETRHPLAGRNEVPGSIHGEAKGVGVPWRSSDAELKIGRASCRERV